MIFQHRWYKEWATNRYMAASYSYFLVALSLRADVKSVFPSHKPIKQDRVLVGEGVSGGNYTYVVSWPSKYKYECDLGQERW